MHQDDGQPLLGRVELAEIWVEHLHGVRREDRIRSRKWVAGSGAVGYKTRAGPGLSAPGMACLFQERLDRYLGEPEEAVDVPAFGQGGPNPAPEKCLTSRGGERRGSAGLPVCLSPAGGEEVVPKAQIAHRCAPRGRCQGYGWTRRPSPDREGLDLGVGVLDNDRRHPSTRPQVQRVGHHRIEGP